MRRRYAVAAIAVAALAAAPSAVAWLRVLVQPSAPSVSLGEPVHGMLENGRPFPPWGDGYRTYSLLGSALGRQYAHAAVRDAVVAAFAARARAEPGRTFVLAETGWPGGGPFRPHRTHQAGTSVDVLVPMRDAHGAPASLSTWPWDRFGYGHELDAGARLGDLSLDFPALAALIGELDAQARRRGAEVRRVILAPEFGARLSRELPDRLAARLVRMPVWIRHDEHVHVDFDVNFDLE